MKKELKVAQFTNPTKLADFVNNNRITQENIQKIFEYRNFTILLYWEITV